jgi:hypothetical protein
MKEQEMLKLGISDQDLDFVIETVNPELMTRKDTIKSDPSISEAMLEQENEKLFNRLMLIGGEEILLRISPRLLFDILLRRAVKDLGSQDYTLERTASQKVPVFDSRQVVSLLRNREVRDYLVEMLCSFTKIESFTISVKVGKNLREKVRFNDMDIDSLERWCQKMDEEFRFGFYKRIADVCLFILGIFPEYVIFDYPLSGESKPAFRLRKSGEDYEEEGRKFYKLAAQHRNAQILNLAEVLSRLSENFNLAKKPLNLMSERYIQFTKSKLFPIEAQSR